MVLLLLRPICLANDSFKQNNSNALFFNQLLIAFINKNNQKVLLKEKPFRKIIFFDLSTLTNYTNYIRSIGLEIIRLFANFHN
jgi:hypothetical protein